MTEHKGITRMNVRPGIIELTAHTDIEGEYLQNAFVKLGAFSQSGYAPEVFNYRRQERQLIMEDLGESEPITDPKEFRRNIAFLIQALKRFRIHHGDATRHNIIVKDNKPYLIDFQQARFEHEPGPSKRPGQDADWLWMAAEELTGDRTVARWRALREKLRHGTMLDLGCAQGDFVFFALVENPKRIVHGVDSHRQKMVSPDLTGALFYNDIVHWENFKYDNVLFLSTLPYVVKEHGWDVMDDTMRAIIADCGTLYFETQIYGDGEGPELFKEQGKVADWLTNFTNNMEIAFESRVEGRPHSRVIWEVKK